MKKGFVLSIAVIMIISSLGFVGCSKKDNVIKIGSILPLTGDAAVYGQWAKQGLELAVNELNNNTNQKKKIKIIYEDDQCGPQAGVNSYHKLVNVDKVKVIIGALCSSSTMAIEPLANKDKVLLFSPGSSSPLLSNSGPYFFRNWPSDIYEGEF
ncbi:MAG: ABC transporter substrate-binding protein, partial [Candidatus Cloacimonadales bacterium]|nr:ABC transporter substrate-binding protein [Candidatus Cloacimonadales bacterium]